MVGLLPLVASISGQVGDAEPHHLDLPTHSQDSGGYQGSMASRAMMNHFVLSNLG
ncbi:MAG: hypothetical protein CM15mP105_2400 [Methanobacteriota archaeon]|nr:MAG: hypothetical protein CM15mP105_2400 [Euryarchaeota archaeon]